MLCASEIKVINRSDAGYRSEKYWGELGNIWENWGIVQNRESGQLRDKMMNRGI